MSGKHHFIFIVDVPCPNSVPSVENTRSNLSPPRRYDDPSTKIWSLYLDQAEKNNERITESWKGDMDAILIFVSSSSWVKFTLLNNSPSFIIFSFHQSTYAGGTIFCERDCIHY